MQAGMNVQVTANMRQSSVQREELGKPVIHST